jgi:hypothetical protein
MRRRARVLRLRLHRLNVPEGGGLFASTASSESPSQLASSSGGMPGFLSVDEAFVYWSEWNAFEAVRRVFSAPKSGGPSRVIGESGACQSAMWRGPRLQHSREQAALEPRTSAAKLKSH